MPNGVAHEHGDTMPPDRAVRLLRAKMHELETQAALLISPEGLRDRLDPADVPNMLGYLAADIALVAGLLADHIEHCCR